MANSKIEILLNKRGLSVISETIRTFYKKIFKHIFFTNYIINIANYNHT
jgi:hypothetical protein